MKKIKNNVLIPICIFIICSVFSVAANASSIIFDSGSLNSGQVNYDGVDKTLSGVSIGIDHLFGQNTAQNSDVNYTCSACVLTFTTGILLSNNNGNYVFDHTGSSININGTILASSGDIVGSISNPLLTGNFTSPINFDLSTLGLSFGTGTDTKHPGILSLFNELPPFTFESATISLNSFQTDSNGGFTTNVLHATVTNSNASPVPVPGAIWLIGTAFIGLVGVGRRRTKL